ncbi:TetR family transcriptional regulator [Mycobacterium saskatchewanense]|uniref:TetR/AcrR family transcriptional regulator n=1 Tax=Mycobacterium saskatchewanense TaxID=220927 RepID=UPI000A16ACAE|nr:TetR/AcrR family transcriptional regulator [Mycobacterium saskatchewanense]BBX65950.1 TetR family transcriptional regulator [Mycobacterium saskatchewanense]
MTQRYDRPDSRQGYLGGGAPRRRAKLAPDPDVRCAILDAASKSVREQGIRGLSVAAVLEQARLSTRAFYRHFESKDQLVAAVFTEMTRVEVLRLKRKMAAADNPVEAVTAWIDGRFDLAFDDNTESDLRRLLLEAQSKVFTSSEPVSAPYPMIFEPLIEQLQQGLDLGVFHDVMPATAAKSLHGVVWAATQRHRGTSHDERAETRRRALRFCLRGLGVSPETIDALTAERVAAG